MKMKKSFAKPRNRVLAVVLCLAMVVGIFATMMANTFASPDPVFFTDEPVDFKAEKIRQIDKGDSITATVKNLGDSAVVGDSVTTSYNAATSILTFYASGGAGKATLVYGTMMTGKIGTINVWVRDNDLVGQYTLTKGHHINASKNSTNTELPLTAKTGNEADVDVSKWEWSSTDESIAQYNPVSNKILTGDTDGHVILTFKCTDVWGLEQSINLMVTVGKPDSDVISDGKGSYFVETDNPYIYIRTDEAGKVKMPLEFVYDKDGIGQGEEGRPAYTVDGEYYVEDPLGSNIFKEVQDDGTLKDGPAIWGGTVNGLGNDSNEGPVVKYGDTYYVDEGQNIFKPVDGTSSGDLVGGGPDSDPSTDPVTPVFDNTANDGKYYVGPFTDEDGIPFYYGDAEGSNDGIQSSATEKGDTDEVYYLQDDGTIGKTKPDKVYDCIITSVTVDPSSAAVIKGDSLTFTATVEGTDGVNDPLMTDVIWTVSGAGSEGTMIVDGVLTVAEDETASALVVTATSVADKSKFASAAVAVENKNLVGVPVADIVPGITFTADDIEWVVLTKDVDNNILVTSVNTVGKGQYGPASVLMPGLGGWHSSLYCREATTIRQFMESYYTNNMKSFHPFAKVTNVRIESSWNAAKDNVGGFSIVNPDQTTPYTRTVDSPNSMVEGGTTQTYIAKTAFALSISEVETYMAKEDTVMSKYRFVAGAHNQYWLRSRAPLMGGAYATKVNDEGEISQPGPNHTSSNDLGYRPAIWVNFD